MDAILALIVFLTAAQTCVASNGLPDPVCTPGSVDRHVTQENIATTICVPGYTKTVRPPVSVTSRIKRSVMISYGQHDAASLYELDHLISLELGGAPADISNLWTEGFGWEWSAKDKDRVENAARQSVCSGAMSLSDAQARISSDWIDLYHELIGDK